MNSPELSTIPWFSCSYIYYDLSSLFRSGYVHPAPVLRHHCTRPTRPLLGGPYWSVWISPLAITSHILQSCGVGPGRDAGRAGARSTRAHGVKCCSRRRREQLASSAAPGSRERCDTHKIIPGRTSTSATKRSVRKPSAGGLRR